MGFVKDHNAGFRQNACIRRAFGLLLDREVREKQMVIDDDDVAFHPAPPHLRNEALIP